MPGGLINYEDGMKTMQGDSVADDDADKANNH